MAANLILSEFIASNTSILEDAYGDSPDWIEIHNHGDAAVDLLGYHLTDNASNPTKWTFPSSRVLGPNQYRVSRVWADRSIVNKWLQVTLNINGVSDVFQFGNEIGETGNDPNNAIKLAQSGKLGRSLATFNAAQNSWAGQL